MHILVVDDHDAIRELCGEIADSMNLRVSTAEDGAAALRLLEDEPVDILMTDLEMPGLGGMELMERFKEISPKTEVVIMSGNSSVALAVQALKLGAYDYLEKPFTAEEVSLLLERLMGKLELESENRILREQVRGAGGYGELLGSAPSMLQLFKLIAKASQGHYPVLIQGESGTGKEMVAKAIHESGPLAGRPFLPVDCGALVGTLIESELFGYTRGAFTGAVRTKEGLLEAAQGGTVFLDEIGEMPVDMQSKLLRALQEKEVRPVGSNRRVKINARVIAASNRDLETAVNQGTFRKDLYFRLNVVSIRLPALRERKSDIPMLLNHFLDKFKPQGKTRLTVSEEAMNRLMAYDWPGNVRELEHCIERAVALGSGPVLQSADLASNLQYGHAAGPVGSFAATAAGGVLRVAPPASAISGGSQTAQASAAVSSSSASAAAPVPSVSLPRPAFTPFPQAPPEAGSAPGSLLENRIIPLTELEKQAILRAIQDAGGDKIMAARLLGIGKTTLYRKLKEYRLPAI